MRCVLFCCAERAAHLTHQANSCADLFAGCSFRHGLRRATFLREEGFGFTRSPTCLSLWERCRVATERAGSFFEGAGLPPCGKTEGVLQIGKIRMRFSLMQTCQRAAPSVTACAAPPSSGRKAFVLRPKQNRASFDTLSLWWEVVDSNHRSR